MLTIKNREMATNRSVKKEPSGSGECAKKCVRDDNDLNCTWDLSRELSEQVECDQNVINNVVRLFDEDNTIPFIARYRQHLTNSMEPDKLREVKEKLEELREVQSKVVSVIKKVEKLGKMNGHLKSAFLCSRTLEEVEHLYAPFKPTSKKALADRARDLGLEPLALRLLSNAQLSSLGLREAVNARKQGLSSVLEVETGVQHIIADMISKDHRALDFIRQLCRTSRIFIRSTRCKMKTKKEKEEKACSTKTAKQTSSKVKKETDADKYELYFAFTCDVKTIQPHQVLAINRGESRKVLSVKVDIPDGVLLSFRNFCRETFVPKCCTDKERYRLIMASVDDAYKRLIEPLMTRSIRRDLNRAAEKASVSVFASNLKNLLLTPPVRGKAVLGVDPGFTHGCKYALISSLGSIETTGIAYLHSRKDGIIPKKEMEKIINIIKASRCETVAIGNGVGCRETEMLFSDEIKRGTFHPLHVVFSIVSEAGASVYSASEEASREMPHLGISLRGAVSIARRLQDPLAELVKIDPKNIGVGMYQHDISEKLLKGSLDGVVEECVSFVGADVNVSSEALLRHVAGINASLAKKIVDYRNSQGPFRNRASLMVISGLGPKTFEQCAGFLRIMPETRDLTQTDELETEEGDRGGAKRAAKNQGGRATKKKKTEISSEINNLDMTCIHPESYSTADRVIALANLNKSEVGLEGFIKRLKCFVDSTGVGALAEKLMTTKEMTRQITTGLMQPVGHDLRDDNEKPLFRESIRSMSDLKIHQVVSGKVTNVTHFGAFVDIGVGRDGLIHGQRNGISQPTLHLGNLVEVTVQSLNLERERIGLTLLRVTG